MSTTPFPNMPGAGAMTDSLEFVKNLWGSMGVPGMSMPSLAAPAMSVEDLDKKIADLKAVESWLNVNGAMLRATIQGLEVQRGTLATLNTMGASFADAMKTLTPEAAGKAASKPAAPAMPDPTIWWNMLQEQFKQAVASAVPAAPFGATEAPKGERQDAPAAPKAGAAEVAPPRSARKPAKG
ncbi:PhaM family polyhydroxyalkanoate granule multifunctional regulatory protein [Massilia sp. DWR3-1-1]|uniref:PhaM family polyhydroxyalkanoate granule multifunctional regulatory protein n=1 Tax=Massilia sp. DWR3-1-1 TaxID=2804559 RepID=UPI003CF2F644